MKRKALNLLLFVFMPLALVSQSFSEPPISPAQVKWDGQNLTMTYNGTVLLQGLLESPESLEYYNVLEDTTGKAVNQVIQLVSRKEPLRLTGMSVAEDMISRPLTGAIILSPLPAGSSATTVTIFTSTNRKDLSSEI